jgi:hypothetical protein
VSETSVQGWSLGGKSHGIHRYIDRAMQLVKKDNPTLSPRIDRTWIDSWGRAEVMAIYRIHPSEMGGRTTEGISSR